MTTFADTVELYIDGAWLDITRLDVDTHVVGAIVIERGRSDEQSESAPTSVKFRYLDNNLTLDTDNPYSAYYRKISVPGTPLRVKLDGNVRAVVEIVGMPVEPGDTPEVNYINVEAAGLLRALDEGQKPLSSSMSRLILSSNPKSYWPLNEGTNATQFSSGMPGGAPLIISGARPGAVDGPSPGENFPDVASSGTPLSAQGAINPGLAAAGWGVEFLVYIGEPAVAGETPDLVVLQYTIAGHGLWRVFIGNQSGPDPYIIIGGNIAGVDSSVYDTSSPTFGWNHIRVTYHQNGGNVDIVLYVNGVSIGGLADISTAGTLTAPNGNVIVGQTVAPTGTEYMEQASVGMLAFYDYADAVDHSEGATSYAGEAAGTRMLRLAAEQGIDLSVEGNSADTEEVDAQSIDTFLQLLRDAATVDLGVLGESRDALELHYRTRTSLYNQATPYRLTFAHLQPGFRPTPDDQRVTNDVVVDRPGGSNAEYAIPDGDFFHYSTEQPPDGAGVRDGQATVPAASDTQLNNQAGMRAHIGSWREKRYVGVTFEMAKPVFDADDVTAVLALDIGDLLVFDMTGAPRYAPFNELRLIVQGYTETLSKHLHTITFNTTPADIYEVAQVDSGPTSVLANLIDDNDTSIKIAPGDGKPFSESTTDLPYHVQVNGQPMTVTAISTDTAAFIAAGAVSYADNAAVTPALPAGMTPDVGQLMVAYIFRRASGAGIISTNPTGWDTIAEAAAGDWRLAGRYYRTGDAAVQWTFSGGAANDTTGGVVLGFSGLSMVLDKNIPAGYSAGYVTSINSSAQNIAYPVYLNRRTKSAMIIAGKKDDDWTSVATIAGCSEPVDSSSTTGSDIGVVIDLYNPGTPTTVAAGSFVVTGGASAVSEGTVFGLRPLQTATVTRGVAGVATSASPGSEIHGWRMGVNGL